MNKSQTQKIKYNPLDYQKKFHASTKPKVYLSAGLGAGKTYSLCMHMFKLMDLNRGLAGGFLAPTLKMAKKDVIPTILEICAENKIDYNYNRTDSVFYFPATKSTIYFFHGEDKGYSIRGPNLAFFLINEVTLIDFETFSAAVGRIRLKNAKLRQLAMSGSPESFSWHYDYFIEKPREDTDVIFGNTRLNSFVSDDYVKNLEASYDAKMQEQFIDGKFVNLKGNRCAWSFDRFKHVGEMELNPNQIWVSIDFNVTPMAATLWAINGPDSTIRTYAFDEICIKDSNTWDLAKVLKSKLEDYGFTDLEITLYPDPAGAARTTKSTRSDIQILRDEGFNNIKYRAKIRSVKDCLNSMNNRFDKNTILINPKCTNLIADLERCKMKDNGLEIDKSDIMRSHWIDGAKNMFEYEFPIINRKPQEMIVRHY